MTAEIAILNQHGVALAADSAVSIGDNKVYNSANKLFALSKSHPVGIMVYGNGCFQSLPWETIIKQYRDKFLRHSHRDTLLSYAQDFIDYLSSSDIFGPDLEKMYVRNLTQAAARDLLDALVKRPSKTPAAGQENPAEREKFALNFVNDQISYTNALNRSPNYAPAVDEHIEVTHGAEIRSQCQNYSNQLGVSRAVAVALQRWIRTLLAQHYAARTQHLWDLSAGVVIAGYGESEICPSIAEFKIAGRLGSYLHMSEVGHSSYQPGYQGLIFPFAQKEVVETFLGGIDERIANMYSAGMQEVINKLPNVLATANLNLGITDEVKAEIRKQLHTAWTKTEASVRDYRNREFRHPVHESVSFLPLDELAAMAHSLVNLTSFKRRVTLERESVGGPIDVAVISKGDGFIWIKRKHYFPAELNHHYFSHKSGARHVETPAETVASEPSGN